MYIRMWTCLAWTRTFELADAHVHPLSSAQLSCIGPVQCSCRGKRYGEVPPSIRFRRQVERSSARHIGWTHAFSISSLAASLIAGCILYNYIFMTYCVIFLHCKVSLQHSINSGHITIYLTSSIILFLYNNKILK
jgi:hypothetical protein